MEQLEILPLESHHWPAVAEIYAAGMDTGLATFETRVPSWEAWDRDHLDAPRLTAQWENLVLGWAALSPFSSRAVYAGVAEVSVYVHLDRRRRGIGRRLLEALVPASEASGIWTLQAKIFPENEASLRLHQRCGFRVVGRRERLAQRDGMWRDVVLLERRSRVVGIERELE